MGEENRGKTEGTNVREVSFVCIWNFVWEGVKTKDPGGVYINSEQKQTRSIWLLSLMQIADRWSVVCAFKASPFAA